MITKKQTLEPRFLVCTLLAILLIAYTREIYGPAPGGLALAAAVLGYTTKKEKR